jgi:uncharacterized protein involved in oxidation of intracellular sulfur
MKTLIILNDPPTAPRDPTTGFGSRARWRNARAKWSGCSSWATPQRVAKGGQKVPQGYYNLSRMLQVVSQHRGEIGVCGSCMEARGLQDTDLVQGSRRSTLEELTDRTLWADRILVF